MTKTAFLFPGQSSQSVGMMQAYGHLPAIKKTFEEASDLLGQDMWDLVQNGPTEALNQTTNTQPVMLTAGVAVYRAWQEMGGFQPDFVAGHSLGEYSALVAAEVLTFAEALPLVRFRAESMQNAVPEGIGGIAAILGLDSDTVKAVCAEAAQNDVLEAVNLNSPEQTVIAGHKVAVERGMVLAKSKGAKRALMLPMSAPSHCALMRPAAEKLAEKLTTIVFKAPRLAIINNVDVASETDPEKIKAALVRQLYCPVRWVELIQSLAAQGVSFAAECGPGKVLAGLNKRIVKEMAVEALTTQAALEHLRAQA